MYTNETKIKVRYSETDQMGYVYHGNYAIYLEVARVEALRCIGISYREIEERGIMLPVLNLSSAFIKPAFYDETLSVKTYIDELPITRIKFRYEIYNPEGKLLNKAFTEHAFINVTSRRPVKAPDFLLEKLTKVI